MSATQQHAKELREVHEVATILGAAIQDDNVLNVNFFTKENTTYAEERTTQLVRILAKFQFNISKDDIKVLESYEKETSELTLCECKEMVEQMLFFKRGGEVTDAATLVTNAAKKQRLKCQWSFTKILIAVRVRRILMWHFSRITLVQKLPVDLKLTPSN